jgi:hypothetical protein
MFNRATQVQGYVPFPHGIIEPSSVIHITNGTNTAAESPNPSETPFLMRLPPHMTPPFTPWLDVLLGQQSFPTLSSMRRRKSTVVGRWAKSHVWYSSR